MKNLLCLMVLAILSGVCIYSCTDGTISDPAELKSSENQNRLMVQQDETGVYSFVENKNKKISNSLEELILNQQSELTRIDEFGFGKTQDENPRDVFFIKEFNEDLVKTLFIVLEETAEGKPYVPTNSIGFWICVSRDCCQQCVLSGSTCVCHNIDVACDSQDGGSSTCYGIYIHTF